ncbi:hypothetical protein [Rhizomicrobium electricum]|jgi:hypothetical protein|uniref:Uncharacterized protein n=1 Tax=Rhizomicrobium electricum TaxID=480070 RepID=A0ABN1ELG3_9PROT|nr:hypothetical protein [Rhizomicrobium electricum]NIJ47047.1 hypothetical protein [Rhizomicrobium electricum]
MLRNVVLAIGGAMLIFGVMGMVAGSFTVGVPVAVWGAIFVFGILYERYAYKSLVDKVPTGKGWTRTTERFVDEKSGRTVTVYVKPLTGERAYVTEPVAPAAPPPVVEG